MQRRLGAARPSTGRGRYFSIRKPNRLPDWPSVGWLPVTDIASLPMTDRLTRLAALSVHGANVQEGQIVLVGDEIGLEEQARATAEAAYKRGAKFVDVAYFDPYVKRVPHLTVWVSEVGAPHLVDRSRLERSARR